MYRCLLATLCVATFLVPAFADGSDGLHRAQIEATALGGGAYVVTGGISNTGFVIGPSGVIVIDAQMFAEDAQRKQAAIAKLTTKPVTTLILTHSDVDHVYGLPAWPRGLRIIAQENVRSQMEAMIAKPDPRQPPLPANFDAYLPTHTLRHAETTVIDGVEVAMTHLRAGHTNGDLVIHFPKQRVAFVGDLLTIGDPNLPTAGLYPVIHLDKFGSSAGWIAVMKAVLELEADVFIGGHGTAPITREQLKEAVAATGKRRAEVKRLFDGGSGLPQIKAALNDPPPAAPLFFPTFVETVYQELLRE